MALAIWLGGLRTFFLDSQVSKTSFTQYNDANLVRLEVAAYVWRLSTQAPRK